MITVSLRMKLDQTPLKRVPVSLCLDADGHCTPPVHTDREGRARFDIPEASGKVLVDGVERYHGRLAGEVQVELWSITQAPSDSHGLAGHMPMGSNAYPNMQTRTLEVDGRAVLTDGEGYLVNPADWSESFVRALAAAEGLSLTPQLPLRRRRDRRQLAAGLGRLPDRLPEGGRLHRRPLRRRDDQPPRRRRGARAHAAEKPDIVGCTAITPAIYKAERLLQIAKEVNPRPSSPCSAASTAPSCTSRC
jgi:hypothetical protein